jgi:hypothetical protein
MILGHITPGNEYNSVATMRTLSEAYPECRRATTKALNRCLYTMVGDGMLVGRPTRPGQAGCNFMLASPKAGAEKTATDSNANTHVFHAFLKHVTREYYRKVFEKLTEAEKMLQSVPDNIVKSYASHVRTWDWSNPEDMKDLLSMPDHVRRDLVSTELTQEARHKLDSMARLFEETPKTVGFAVNHTQQILSDIVLFGSLPNDPLGFDEIKCLFSPRPESASDAPRTMPPADAPGHGSEPADNDSI